MPAASCRLKSVLFAAASNGVPAISFWNQRIHSFEPTGGTLSGAWKVGFIGDSCGLSAVMWQLMQALTGLSTGPSRRPFQPRWVGGNSGLALIAVSLRSGLIFVTVGCLLVYLSPVS